MRVHLRGKSITHKRPWLTTSTRRWAALTGWGGHRRCPGWSQGGPREGVPHQSSHHKLTHTWCDTVRFPKLMFTWENEISLT